MQLLSERFPFDLGQLGTSTGEERLASGHGCYLSFHLDQRNRSRSMIAVEAR